MAKKINQAATSADSSADAEDLNILFPNVEFTLLDQKIKVSEYAFMQWLELKDQHIDFLEHLTNLVDESEEGINMDDLLEFFETHFHQLQTLLCASINQSIDFLKKLNDSDMNMLILTWWQVNKHFFLRHIHRKLRKKKK